LVTASWDSNNLFNSSHASHTFDCTWETTLLSKQLLIIMSVSVSRSSQLLILLAPTEGAIGLVLVPLTIDQNFYVLNNNINLCFQTWKYVPSNFGIWLMSIFVWNILLHYFNESVACAEANPFVFKAINLIKCWGIIVLVIQFFHYVESNVVRFLYTIRTCLLIMQFAPGNFYSFDTILETWKKHLVWFTTHSCKLFYTSLLRTQDQKIYTIVKVDTKRHFLGILWVYTNCLQLAILVNYILHIPNKTLLQECPLLGALFPASQFLSPLCRSGKDWIIVSLRHDNTNWLGEKNSWVLP